MLSIVLSLVANSRTAAVPSRSAPGCSNTSGRLRGPQALRRRCGWGQPRSASAAAHLRFRSCVQYCGAPTLPRSDALTLLTLLTSCLLLTGCAGYKLGPTNGVIARDKSVQFNPFGDQTLQPRLSDAVAQQLRKELQRDGTYSLAT